MENMQTGATYWAIYRYNANVLFVWQLSLYGVTVKATYIHYFTCFVPMLSQGPAGLLGLTLGEGREYTLVKTYKIQTNKRVGA